MPAGQAKHWDIPEVLEKKFFSHSPQWVAFVKGW
jgi:hypothetical protein